MLSAASMLFLAVAVLIVLAIIVTQLAWLGLIAVLIALLGAAGRYFHWRTTEFVITTDRIITREGIFSKQGREIPLDRVMNLAYHQSIWERLLGAGDLVVESAGETGHTVFSDVSNPAYIENLIYRQAEMFEQGIAGTSARMSGAAPIGPAGHRRKGGLGDSQRGETRGESGAVMGGQSIPEQIEKLAELHQRGILSDEEFSDKKHELLNRM